jgi:hypothetical protein
LKHAKRTFVKGLQNKNGNAYFFSLMFRSALCIYWSWIYPITRCCFRNENNNSQLATFEGQMMVGKRAIERICRSTTLSLLMLRVRLGLLHVVTFDVKNLLVFLNFEVNFVRLSCSFSCKKGHG